MADTLKMKWQKDLDTFYPIYNTLILEGNVDDDQPYEDENGEISYCKLCDYFDKVYSHDPDSEDQRKRKRVIIYDPTEGESRRFKICSDEIPEITVNEDTQSSEPKYKYVYESRMSQHFWNIVNDFKDEDGKDLLEDHLVAHRASGPSLDFARIHYAVTEGSDRIKDEERIEKFSDILSFIRGNTPEPDPNEPEGYLFVLKMTSRLLTREGLDNDISAEELMIFRQLLTIAQSIDVNQDPKNGYLQKNKLVILASKIEALPEWFVNENLNPYIKRIKVELPSEENRLDFFDDMLERTVNPASSDIRPCFTPEFITKYNELVSKSGENTSASNADERRVKNPAQKKFLAYTNDFGMKMLLRYRAYLENEPLADPDKLAFSINKFRLGDMTNPWDDPERIKEMLNIKQAVSKKIKGQDYALDAAQEILARAAIGLDRAENPNAPRVVLFLAGPTGTGKTELCKQLAEAVFGSEDRIIRFDMSEYGQEESDQKLFGAPPGYIGYSEGGKLTNAVKKEPFSLILFDEIEKAHNSILDKFLQILGDGRLTDGKGETVRFSDCIIVITSNAGVVIPRKPSGEPMKPAEIKDLMDNEDAPSGEMNIAEVCRLEAEVDENGNRLNTSEQIYERVREHLRYNVKAYFNCKLGRPELYGRIESSIVYYNYIGAESVEPIVKSKIKDVIGSAKEAVFISDIDYSGALGAIVNACQESKVRGLGARGIIKTTGKIFNGSLTAFLKPYFVGKDENGVTRNKEELVGKTLVCVCEDEKATTDNIKWSIR